MDSLLQIESILEIEVQRELLAVAHAAAANAHAPYSNFQVGAAVLDFRNRVFGGCNVENASYGLTLCAERNAVGAAVGAGAQRLHAVGIYTPTGALTMPCGACRQVLAEFGRRMEVHIFNHDGGHAVFSLEQLLPGAFAFDPAHHPPG